MSLTAKLAPREALTAKMAKPICSAGDLVDIEAALDGIIAIQEELIGVTLITFYFAGLELTAEAGMTWGEYIDSEYNTHEFWSDGNYVCDSNGANFVDHESNIVTPAMVIIAGVEYDY